MAWRISTVFLALICTIFVLKIKASEELQNDLILMVERVGEESEKAFLRGDVNELSGFWTEDIISLPNQGPMIRGKEELKKTMAAVMNSGIKFEFLESKTIEVKICGEYLCEIGTFSQSVLVPNSTEPIKDKGKYLNLWKRQPDGSLKIAAEIFNTDIAAK